MPLQRELRVLTRMREFHGEVIEPVSPPSPPDVPESLWKRGVLGLYIGTPPWGGYGGRTVDHHPYVIELVMQTSIAFIFIYKEFTRGDSVDTRIRQKLAGRPDFLANWCALHDRLMSIFGFKHPDDPTLSASGLLQVTFNMWEAFDLGLFLVYYKQWRPVGKKPRLPSADIHVTTYMLQLLNNQIIPFIRRNMLESMRLFCRRMLVYHSFYVRNSATNRLDEGFWTDMVTEFDSLSALFDQRVDLFKAARDTMLGDRMPLTPSSLVEQL